MQDEEIDKEPKELGMKLFHVQEIHEELKESGKPVDFKFQILFIQRKLLANVESY